MSRDVCHASEQLGFAFQQSGDFESALPYFRQAAAISENLVAADPKDERYELNRIVAYIRIGEAQLAEAEKTFQRHLQLCEENADPRPDDSAAQRQLAVAYYKMADAARARAGDESRADRQRRNHWIAAQSWLRRCHAVFIDMRNRKILSAGDQGVPDMIAGEIESCGVQLASLEHDEP